MSITKYKFTFFIVTISLIANFALLFLFLNQNKNTPSKIGKSEKFELLAKRIFLENPSHMIINFTVLRQTLRDYISSQNGSIGIYFEYLPTGVSIGISDRELFRRASLIKLPTVMRIYKLIEEGKLKKNELLTLKKTQLDQGYGDLWHKGEGYELSVEDAINQALVYSDNTAANLLEDTINQKLALEEGSENQILTIYDYFDVPRAEKGMTFDISPKGFASILKSLFFSSYLQFENSNEILSILSIPKPVDVMLSVPIPKQIKTAHKFGVNREGTEKSLVTSDCGIIYIPERPYLLCVMIKEAPEIAATKIIKVSEMVYEFVSSANHMN